MGDRSMEIKQLESFVTACERGSLSQAAACMYTTQPNVSKTIRTLEHELGRPLLVRSGKGVQPTVYGKNVLEYAKLILRATATISSLAVPDEQNGLRLSAYPSNMVSRLLVDFYKTWGSGIHIEHHEGTVEEITDHVHQGISEVGIVYVAQKQVPTFQHILLHKKLEFIPQSEKSICAYVGPQHPLYHADSVDFSDLPNLKFMRGVRDFFSMEHHLETVSIVDDRCFRVRKGDVAVVRVVVAVTVAVPVGQVLILRQHGIEQRRPVPLLLGKIQLVHVLLGRQITDKDVQDAVDQRGRVGQAVIHHVLNGAFIHSVKVLFIPD